MEFQGLGLSEPILRAIGDAGYRAPTPIQRRAIGPAIVGRDILGCAQTGTGKTAAFCLPILHRMHAEESASDGGLRALILTPTRELAAQIGKGIQTYGAHLKLRHAVIFGGVDARRQISALRKGVDIIVATPGRLLDLQARGIINLDDVRYFVIDEADRMLDMGFLPDVRRVVARLPKSRQTLFFSATMPKAIQKLVETLLDDPVTIEVDPVSSTAERIEQGVYFVEKSQKRHLLQRLLTGTAHPRTLVFSRTKHGANRIARNLQGTGIEANAIHGNKSQNARTRALADFRSGKVPVLIATDIAARGIDIDDVTQVINYDLPNVPETYVHRIGRTARAGKSGIAISFCDGEERAYLKDIEKLIDKELDRLSNEPARAAKKPKAETSRPKPVSAKPKASDRPRQRRSGRGAPSAKPTGQGRRGANPKSQSDGLPAADKKRQDGGRRPAKKKAASGRRSPSASTDGSNNPPKKAAAAKRGPVKKTGASGQGPRKKASAGAPGGRKKSAPGGRGLPKKSNSARRPKTKSRTGGKPRAR